MKITLSIEVPQHEALTALEAELSAVDSDIQALIVEMASAAPGNVTMPRSVQLSQLLDKANQLFRQSQDATPDQGWLQRYIQDVAVTAVARFYNPQLERLQEQLRHLQGQAQRAHIQERFSGEAYQWVHNQLGDEKARQIRESVRAQVIAQLEKGNAHADAEQLPQISHGV